MASIDLLVAFMIATITYAIVPGPGTFYIAAQTIAHDPLAALRGALGLHLGGYVIVVCSAAGLTALFAVVPVLYEGLKLLGAAYLVWLGLRIILLQSESKVNGRQQQPGQRRPNTFSQGLLVEMLNPTTVVFYVAFLPQFIVPAGDLPVWLQFTILGVVVNLIFSLGDVVTILIAASVKAKTTHSERGRRIFQRIGGTVLIGLGLRLATDRS